MIWGFFDFSVQPIIKLSGVPPRGTFLRSALGKAGSNGEERDTALLLIRSAGRSPLRREPRKHGGVESAQIAQGRSVDSRGYDEG